MPEICRVRLALFLTFKVVYHAAPCKVQFQHAASSAPLLFFLSFFSPCDGQNKHCHSLMLLCDPVISLYKTTQCVSFEETPRTNTTTAAVQ